MSAVPPAVAPTAAQITVQQTLHLLDGPFLELAAGVADRRFSLWLGSGISRESVDDLKAIIRRVLEYLHGHADFTDNNCDYARALRDALALAQLSDIEKVGFDLTQAPADWDVLQVILNRLQTKYARLLDIRLTGKKADFILWEVVDVPATFADPAMQPDCEHYCVAILFLEGVLGNMASANWDGLIEKATDELIAGGPKVLRVCIRPDDFRAPLLRGDLLKFHGCAVCAAADPTTYRDFLVGRETQIAEWPGAAETAVMRQHLIGLATQSPTLMIGLSAQDSNIKDVFIAAKQTMAWIWPAHPPAYVFAEDVLGDDQRALLKCVYRDQYDTQAAAIEAGAQVRAFAKPLLISLVLQVLHRKLSVYIEYIYAPTFAAADRQALVDGLKALRDLLASGADGDRLAFIRQLVVEVSRALDLFREGSAKHAAFSYRPISVQPANQIGADPSTATSGLPGLATTLGIIGLGTTAGEWDIGRSDPTTTSSGSIRVTPKKTGTPNRIFFAASAEAGLQLHLSGAVNDNDADAVVIYSSAPPLRLPRSSRGAPGRTGIGEIREVGVRDLLASSRDVEELQRRFREEAVL